MNQKALAKISININREPKNINIFAGKPIFILGGNGTGKSALAQNIAQQLSSCMGNKFVYMPGSRPSYFNHESLSMTPQTRRDFDKNLSWYSNHEARWKSRGGSVRNEKAIHDLLAAETQYKVDKANQIGEEGKESPAIALLQEKNSPLDKVNALLKQARLPIDLIVESGDLRASKDQSTYSYAKMSDGERMALVFASEVASAKPGEVFVVDEPELHLHPSIVVSLIRALVLERPDCGFVICTHELHLPQSISEAQMLLVRGCTWLNESVNSWDIDLIEDKNTIPESLWTEVVGSRRKILFVEGENTSLDQPLYSILFPQVSVHPCKSCRDVIDAVRGLRAMEKNHRVKAFGIIDGDGMDATNKQSYQQEFIFPLPVYSVESLLYAKECINEIAKRQAETLGEETDQLFKKTISRFIEKISQNNVSSNLASKVAERHLRETVFSKLPKRNDLKSSEDRFSIEFENPFPTELQALKNLIKDRNYSDIVSRYPIRESGALKDMANELRFNSNEQLEKAIITRIQQSDTLQETLRNKLEGIKDLL